jgi:Ti-type conjugative transfer relaxase TraA
VLSIGKLVSGAERYYLSVVAAGREEYYTGSGEAPGVWIGEGAERLGLGGEVEPEHLRMVLEGASPLDGAQLVPRRLAAGRVAGFDLTFSAPKSVSLLYGLGSDDVADAVRSSHDAASRDALRYLERHALYARRGAGGEQRIETIGAVAAAFRHRTSRAGDPQLHTHVLLANVVEGSDGRYSALDARLIYFHGRTAGFVYQAVLRAELSSRLGLRFEPSHNGLAEIEDADKAMLRAFATRRSEIEVRLEQWGQTSTRAAEFAALDTRPAKNPTASGGSPHASLRDTWRERARALGHDPESLADLLGPPRVPTVSEPQAIVTESDLLGPEGLTAQESAFERRDVVRAVAEHMKDGAFLAEIESITDRVLSSSQVVTLGTIGRGGEIRSTTAELLAIETEMLESARVRRGTEVGLVFEEALDASLSARSTLSDEQQSMVRTLTGSGDGVQVVIGKAGTGKTFALDAARAAWEGSGFKVTGAALAARAAAELRDGAGIRSTTLARLLIDLVEGSSVLGCTDVLVVDEAGMVGTRQLARVLGHASAGGAKVVLVGDPRQLPEIEAGGALGALANALGKVELTSNRRQSAGWERAALDELRSGDVGVALRTYEEAGHLHLAPSAATARSALVSDWLQSRSACTDARMYAARRDDVDWLNGLARSELRRRGILGPDLLGVAGSARFALGDEVLCLRNDRRLEVMNGTLGKVSAMYDGGLLIETPSGPRKLSASYLEEGFLAHGYASTIHKAQGATVERAFVLGTASVFREAGYVAMSRARGGTDLYVVGGAFESGLGDVSFAEGGIAGFLHSVSVSRAKALASTDPRLPLPDGPVSQPGRSVDSPSTSGRHTSPSRPIDHLATHSRKIPAYLVKAIGPRPGFAEERPDWIAAARAIDGYRSRFGVTSDAPLGPRPKDPVARLRYDEVLEVVVSYRRRLERVLEPPGPDLGLDR